LFWILETFAFAIRNIKLQLLKDSY